MKEATGELNMTVITIVAIGALMGFFYLIIWPNLKQSMALNSACNSAGASTKQNSGKTIYESGTAGTEGYIHCTSAYAASSGTVTCYYFDGTKDNSKVCD